MSENSPGNTAKTIWHNWCEEVQRWAVVTWTRNWIEKHPLWAIAHFFNLLAAIFIYGKGSGIPIFPVVIFMCIIFVQIYTERIAPIPGEADQATKIGIEEIRSQQRNKWMIFAYSFMLLSLLLTISPFIDPLFKDLKVKPEESYLGTLRERPIAVFIGCTKDSKAANLRCDENVPPQTSIKPNDAVSLAQPNEGTQTPSSLGNDDKKTNPSEAAKTGLGYAWVINIGGHIEKCNQDDDSAYGKSVTCEVKDGLLIPLYFIIMALMGGSISLTRRLPELQKQAGSEHIATEQQPKLSQYEFREHLIFQMVQFISAPFLAILAYYLIEPSNATNAVALAFIAGFASETILLMVRSVANKITPQTAEALQYGAIAGIVRFEGNDKEIPQTAEVFLTELPHQAHAVTDTDGFYTLNNVPVGDHSLSVKYLNQNEILATSMVKVTHAQAVVKKNFDIPKQERKEPALDSNAK